MGIGTILLLTVLAVIGAVLFLASRKPDIFRVERRVIIHAPADKVFAHINDLHAWETWSPWQKKDPAMKQVYSGSDAGVGAAQAWEGNNQVGKGSMTIIAAEPPRRIDLQLDFEKPFKANNIVEFTLTPTGNSTEIVWAMHGPANLVSKIMDVLMNMDKMCGRDFDAGLANLKAIAEHN